MSAPWQIAPVEAGPDPPHSPAVVLDVPAPDRPIPSWVTTACSRLGPVRPMKSSTYATTSWFFSFGATSGCRGPCCPVMLRPEKQTDPDAVRGAQRQGQPSFFAEDEGEVGHANPRVWGQNNVKRFPGFEFGVKRIFRRRGARGFPRPNRYPPTRCRSSPH